MTNIYILITVVINLVLAIYVFSRGHRNPLNIAFVLFVLNVSSYLVLLFALSFIQSHASTLVLGRLAFATISFAPYCFVIFCLLFLQDQPTPRILRQLAALLLLPVANAVLALTDLIVRDNVHTAFGIRPVYGDGIYLFLAYNVIYLFFGVWLLIKGYASADNPLKRVQIRYVLAGLSFPMFLMIVFSLVLPLMGVRAFSQLGPLVSVLIFGVIAYAIVRHRFMDVRVILHRGIVFSVTVGFMSFFFVMIIFFFQDVIQKKIGMDFVSAAILSSVAIAVVFQPFRNLIQQISERYIFKGFFDYGKIIDGFSNELARLWNIDLLLEFILQEIVSTLNLTGGTIYALDGGESYDLRCFKPKKGDVPYPGNIPRESPVVSVVKGMKGLLIKDELGLSEGRRSAVDEGLQELDAAVVVPLATRKGLIGFVALGSKASGQFFSAEDIQLLTTLGRQSAIAIENASLYQEVLEIKDYSERILEQMSSGVVSVDERMQITTLNRRAQEIIGVGANGALGRSIDAIQQELAALLEGTFRSKGGVVNVEVNISRGELPPMPLSVSTTPLREPTGQVIGALAVFTDLTEIKQLEAEVRRAERLATVGTLAAGMAHEIKNPLVSLKTFSQLLPIKYNDPEFRDSFSQIVGQEVERINNLVEQLLRFARPSRPDFQPVDIHKPIEETLLLVASELSTRKVQVGKQFAREPMTILADGEQLKQVLLNIILNALDALSGREPGLIFISTELAHQRGPRGRVLPKLSQGYSATGQEVLLRISDNGMGIPEQELKHIFDPFFTTKDRGHGLGLSIAHGIIKEHMGTVTVESRPGEGTIFSLAFPVIAQQTGEREDAPDEIRIGCLP